MISISMAGHSLLWWRNQKTLLAYGSPSSRPASYTLSKRYQIVENLRTFRVSFPIRRPFTGLNTPRLMYYLLKYSLVGEEHARDPRLRGSHRLGHSSPHGRLSLEDSPLHRVLLLHVCYYHISIIFPIIFSLFQFMVITTCILSCEKWREKVFPSFGRPLPKRRIHVGTAEQDIYFKQLEAAWS